MLEEAVDRIALGLGLALFVATCAGSAPFGRRHHGAG
jgi:hypothetical protein